MPATAKRRFEFVAGASNKFWEIEVKGKDVLVRFGRNGAHGQSTKKSFSNGAAAQKHADKVIAEKLAKGYVAV